MSIPYPHIEPVLFKIGPFSLRWYSLAYIGGLAAGWWYLTRLIKKTALWAKAGPPVDRKLLDDVVFWVAIGVMAGGRLGYLLFYEPTLIIAPWEKLFGVVPFPPALMTWNGGMSFHGGLIGVALVGILFARKYKLNMLSLGDMFACATPIGLFFGAHKFGLLKRPGAAMGLFLAGYAVSRIIIENFREPDSHMPDFPLGLTMGMMLSVPMLAFGLWLIWRTRTVGRARAAS